MKQHPNQYLVLFIQSTILIVCLVTVLLWGLTFPFPSPIVKPFLEPQKRWPELQVRGWAEIGNFSDDFWAYFTRDPERTIPSGLTIIAPADGRFVYHEQLKSSQIVVIGMSFWDVHVQRAPLDGVVTAVSYQGDTYMDGEGKNQAYLRNKVSPVQGIIHLATEQGPMVIRLITSISARRVQIFVQEGQRIAKGDRIGRILAGSTVALELPASLKVMPKVGSKIVAGETVICRY